MFTFARCLRCSAAVTPAKYELDIIQVTTVLIIRKNWENNGTEKIGLVTPTPGWALPRDQGERPLNIKLNVNTDWFFVKWIPSPSVDPPHKRPVVRKAFPYDVTMRPITMRSISQHMHMNDFVYAEYQVTMNFGYGRSMKYCMCIFFDSTQREESKLSIWHICRLNIFLAQFR